MFWFHYFLFYFCRLLIKCNHKCYKLLISKYGEKIKLIIYIFAWNTWKQYNEFDIRCNSNQIWPQNSNILLVSSFTLIFNGSIAVDLCWSDSRLYLTIFQSIQCLIAYARRLISAKVFVLNILRFLVNAMTSGVPFRPSIPSTISQQTDPNRANNFGVFNKRVVVLCNLYVTSKSARLLFALKLNLIIVWKVWPNIKQKIKHFEAFNHTFLWMIASNYSIKSVLVFIK